MNQPTPPPAKSNPIVRYFKRMGAGSMAISIIVHVVLLIIATVYVISVSHPPRTASFRGGGDGSSATIQRPVKMAPTQPNLSTLNKRLSVASSNAEVALPDLIDTPNPSMSTGATAPTGGPAGLGQGIGNLKGPLMPAFGFKEPGKNGLMVGTLWDLKQTPALKPHPKCPPKYEAIPGAYTYSIVADFFKAGCDRAKLSGYYKSPTTLYAAQIFIPNIRSEEALKENAFNVEKFVKKPKGWIAHYRGKVSPPTSGNYRFTGFGDDILAVRINGKMVLDACFNASATLTDPKLKLRNLLNNFPIGGDQVMKQGIYISMRAGQYYDLDIVIGESDGGSFQSVLLFEQKEVTYKTTPQGYPILPVFRVANTELQPKKYGFTFMTDGPIWNAVPPPTY